MSEPSRTSSPAIDAAIGLLRPGIESRMTEAGYIHLPGERDPTGSHPGQQLMRSRTLPLIYERLWRPAGARVLLGAFGPGAVGEHRIALEMLDISPGDRVLDVACGPGNFTRDFARASGDGIVIGIDASETMLTAAARAGSGPNLAYVRGNASALPFDDGAFDAVCCFAALHLMREPMSALDEMVRVLAPGGRLGLLASCRRGPLPAVLAGAVVRAISGVRLFDRDELTGALAERGMAGIEQRVAGLGQFVWARKPAAAG